MWSVGPVITPQQTIYGRSEARINKIATQYRESPKLLGFIRAYLDQVTKVTAVAERMLDYFDIDTAVGDQLTILGKVLGWPRSHCRGQRRPVFGFACEDECGPSVVPIGGFCEAEWDCGDGPDYIEFTFTDDELYRRFLKARVISLLGDYSREGLTEAARELFDADAVIYEENPGQVGIAVPRLLSGIEISISHLFRQVLPVAPGVRLDIWHSKGVAFGFGEGWGGFCTGRFPTLITIN